MKKIISLALICVLTAGALLPCFTVKAEDTNWYVNGTTLHIKAGWLGEGQKETITEIVADETIKPTSLKFENYSSLKKVDFTNIDLSELTSMENLFVNCPSLKEIDLSNKDASKVVSMKNAFKDLASLESLSLENLKTDSLEDMEGAFENCRTSNCFNVKGINTSKVANMARAFYNCCSMGHTSNILDLTSFDTRNVTNMSSMFENCMVQEIDLSSFDVSRVTDMSNMFKNAQNVYTIYTSKDFTIPGYKVPFKSDGMFEGNYCLAGRSADFNHDINEMNRWKENETPFTKYGAKGGEFALINKKGGEGYFTYKEAPAANTYTIEVINGTCDKTEAAVGEEVTIKANADTEYVKFANWSVEGADFDKTKDTVTFEMPANNVVAAANFVDKIYKVNVINGTCDKSEYRPGEEVKIKADDDDELKAFSGWSTNQAEIKDKKARETSFIMPTNNVVIAANFDKVKHKVKYNLNGGQGKVSVQESLPCGETFVITSDISRDAFEGWSDGEKMYKPGDIYTVGDSDVTLKAVWKNIEAVIEENGAVIAKGTLEEMIGQANPNQTIRLVKDTEMNVPNLSAAFLDLSGHTLKADKVAFTQTQVIDTSKDSTGTLICNETKFVKSEYIPMYAKAEYNFNGEVVTPGWHFYKLKFAIDFGGYFNPKKAFEGRKDLWSNDDNDFGGVKVAYTFKGSNKKALIILANEDITATGLKLTIAPFNAVPNKGELAMPNDPSADKDNPTITIGDEVLKAQNITYYTESQSKTHPALLAKRGADLRGSIKAVAKNILNGQTPDWGSVIMYGTTSDTRIWATYARFKLETNDFVIQENEIQHVREDLR